MGKLTHTVSGRIASFKSADKANITHLKAHFLPIQEGSGDPSPSNVKPITGWTGLTVEKAKKNLFNEETAYENKIWYNGTTYSNYTNYIASDYIKVEPGKKYIGTGRDSAQNQYDFFDENKNYLSQTFVSRSNPVTIPNNAYYVTTQFLKSETERQFMLATESTQYEVYSGVTIPVSWSEQGEIIGGYVDLITGDVVAEYQIYTFTGGFYSYSGNASYNGEHGTNRIHDINIPAGSQCWADKVKKVGSGIWGDPDNNIWNFCTNGLYQLHVVFDNSTVGITSDMDYSERSRKINSWLEENPFTFVFKLQNPIAVGSIDRTNLKAFIGQNNIWSDANDVVEVEYEFTDYMNKRRISLNEPHIITKSGGVGSFWTDLKAPMESLQVEFLPVQSGTGDPSPTNARPISGSTSINILHCHKNLLDPALKKWSNIYDVQKWGMDKAGSVANGELILPAGTYTLSISGLETGVSPSEWSIKDKDGNYFAHYYAGHQSATFTLSQAQAVGIYMSIANTENNRYCLHNRVMLEHGSFATSFEEYQAEMIPVSWSSFGEILGGYVNLTTGAVYQTFGEIALTGGQNYYTGSSYIKSDAFDMYLNISGMIYNTKKVYCNKLKWCTTGPWNAVGYPNQYRTNGRQFHFNIANDLLGITDYTQETTATASAKMKAYLKDLYDNEHPIKLVYNLETPIFVGYIEAMQLKSTIGYNNIWSPAGGDVTVKYWGHN